MSNFRLPLTPAAICGCLLAISSMLVSDPEKARADSFFVDPSHYALYNCDQLVKARKTVADKVAELEGLMAKAETGFAGKLMSGLAYQSEYVAARGELEQIDANRAKNNCGPLPPDKPEAPAAAPAKPSRKKH